MDENKNETMSYFAHEGEMARMERVNGRLWILCIGLIALLVGTNAGWIWYESQFMDSVTVTQDTPNGNNNYVGRDGSITNGTTDNN